MFDPDSSGSSESESERAAASCPNSDVEYEEEEESPATEEERILKTRSKLSEKELSFVDSRGEATALCFIKQCLEFANHHVDAAAHACSKSASFRMKHDWPLVIDESVPKCQLLGIRRALQSRSQIVLRERDEFGRAIIVFTPALIDLEDTTIELHQLATAYLLQESSLTAEEQKAGCVFIVDGRGLGTSLIKQQGVRDYRRGAVLVSGGYPVKVKAVFVPYSVGPVTWLLSLVTRFMGAKMRERVRAINNTDSEGGGWMGEVEGLSEPRVYEAVPEALGGAMSTEDLEDYWDDWVDARFDKYLLQGEEETVERGLSREDRVV